MKTARQLGFAAMMLAFSTLMASSKIVVTVEHNDEDHATPSFQFKTVPPPSKNDLGTVAKFSVTGGEADQNGGDIAHLNDGKLPVEEDQPGENFFFAAGTDGGKVLVDLTKATKLKQINSYSWHGGTRGPQVYKLYGSSKTAAPAATGDLGKAGWKLIANVDTRPNGKADGGQYGVSIADSHGDIGKFRHLLFVISQTEQDDAFGNTFFSEIDLVAKGDPKPEPAARQLVVQSFTTNSPDGKCAITIDTTGAPDLKDWAETKLAPALAEWYPKITTMLASDGYTAPTHFSVTLKPGNGVAATGGTRVTANSEWFKKELAREGVGALIHEEVHVVQQYGYGRRRNPNATRSPGWLVEGIPDYIRFYIYEPQTHGADIKPNRAERARYDGSYRVTANFLNWVVTNHDPKIVQKLNAAMREGKYTDEIWKANTGKTLEELGADWKASLGAKPAAAAPGV